jgi:hypothetical protein
MRDIKGNLWNGIGRADAVIITTNGFVRKDGRATMGAGVALQARHRFPNIDKELGKLINENGSIVQPIREVNGTFLVSFPTKPIFATREDVLDRLKNKAPELPGLLRGCIPGWAAKSTIEIIRRSCQELVSLTDKMKWKKVVLTRPGCGNGELSYYEEVRPILEKYLIGRRFYVIFQPRRQHGKRNKKIRDRNTSSG